MLYRAYLSDDSVYSVVTDPSFRRRAPNIGRRERQTSTYNKVVCKTRKIFLYFSVITITDWLFFSFVRRFGTKMPESLWNVRSGALHRTLSFVRFGDCERVGCLWVWPLFVRLQGEGYGQGLQGSPLDLSDVTFAECFTLVPDNPCHSGKRSLSSIRCLHSQPLQWHLLGTHNSWTSSINQSSLAYSARRWL